MSKCMRFLPLLKDCARFLMMSLDLAKAKSSQSTRKVEEEMALQLRVEEELECQRVRVVTMEGMLFDSSLQLVTARDEVVELAEEG